MPIRGYLEPRRGGLWIATGRPILDGVVQVKGPVLEGRMSFDEALVRDRIRAMEEMQKGHRGETNPVGVPGLPPTAY